MSNNKSKLGGGLWFNILLFNLMGAIAWNVENMYFNTFLYNSVYAGASSEAMAGTMAPTTAISRMVALSAITAVVTTFLMGTLSDRMKNRKFFISVGYIAWGIITALFGFISRDNIATIFNLSDDAKILTTTVWAVIFMDMLMTFMGSTSNDSAFNAWVTDVTTTATRPKVETAFTVNGVLSMGIVMGIGSFAQAGTISYSTFFMCLGAFVILCGIVGLFLIKEPEHKEISEDKTSNYWSDLFYGFKPSVIKKNSVLYLILASVGLYNIAIQIFFPYLFVYLQYVVLPENPNILTPATIITAIIAIAVALGGIITLMKLAGKNKALAFVPGIICLVVGLLVLSLGTNLPVMLLGIGPTLIGYVVLVIQLNASIRDFTPEGMAGRFQGIRMIFMVLLPMVIGPWLGDIACRNSNITYMNEYGVETIVPSAAMFLYASIVSVLALVPIGVLIKKKVFTAKN